MSVVESPCANAKDPIMFKTGLLIILVTSVGCSVSDSERCSQGRIYVSQYGGCVDAVAGASSVGGSQGRDDSGTDDSGSSDATAQTSSFGNTCHADTDCTDGTATLCQLNPQAPQDPGFCTIPNCTPNDCGDAYDCCDCSASALLKSILTVPRCIPTANTSSLTAMACTCS